MDRYIGIAVRADYAMAAVALVRVKNSFRVDAAYVAMPGRLVASDEVDQFLRFDQSDKVGIGCEFGHSVMLEMNIPAELPNDEALGMIRFQLGSMIPVSDADVICHVRRLHKKEQTVEVATIVQDDWAAMLQKLQEADYQADIITTPILAANEGVEDQKFYSPEFEPEFVFDMQGQLKLTGDAAPQYTEEMTRLISEAVAVKKGTGRDSLFAPAIQMALMVAGPMTMLTSSVLPTLPQPLVPRRNILFKRLAMLLTLIVFGLTLALGIRYYQVYSVNSERVAEQNALLDTRIQKAKAEVADLKAACTTAEEALKVMGKPNRPFEILARLGFHMPFEIYAESIKFSNDATIQMVLKGSAPVDEFQPSLAQLKGVTIIELNTQKTGTHRLKLMVGE